jgi:hypothetical protein
VEISKLKDKNNKISKRTSNLMANFFIIKDFGTLIPSYLNGVLIEKYSYNIIFYISTFFSVLILLSGIILNENINVKNKKKKKSKSLDNKYPNLIEQNNKVTKNKYKILNLLNNKKILILFLLIFILESSPSCVSPLFFYETNILGLNPKKLGLIDCISQISKILFLNIYNHFLYYYNFRLVIFISRILIFFNYSLIYLLIKKVTQKYISDFVLLAFASAFNAGFNSLSTLPYSLLCIKFSPLNLEATTSALSISVNYLGKIIADLIDYHLTLYFKITPYNFGNLSKLISVENLLHIIPLIYLLAIPRKFFSAKKKKGQGKELTIKEEEINNNYSDERKNSVEDEEIDENENKKIVEDIVDNYVNNNDIGNKVDDDLNINYRNQNSYRYLFI